MAGFVLLALALRWWPASLALSDGRRSASALAGKAEVRAWLAAAGLLPYYGAEVFGLNAMGKAGVAASNVGFVDAGNAFRYAPAAMTVFGLGLIALGAAPLRR